MSDQPSNLYLRAILEHSADAIVTSDSQGRIVEWNPAAERMYGYRRQEMVGKPAEDLWADPEERRTLLRLMEKKGEIIDYETRIRTKEGRLLDVSVTLSRLKDEKGRPLGTISISKDIRRRKRLERQLKKLAITDSLTGLYNRAHFNQQVLEEVERAKRQGHPLSVSLADLDGFKKYNDGQGHQAGDGALRKVGRAMLSCMRRHVDSAYRYGGDEFTFIFPDLDAKSAVSAAERIRAVVEKTVGPHITASIGVATLQDDETAKELVKRADFAMYSAKATGGNRVWV